MGTNSNHSRRWQTAYPLNSVPDQQILDGEIVALDRHGITHIETTRQAAEARQPFAGKFAATLFTVGIVGVGSRRRAALDFPSAI